jgi:hypothetical protein
METEINADGVIQHDSQAVLWQLRNFRIGKEKHYNLIILAKNSTQRPTTPKKTSKPITEKVLTPTRHLPI